MKKEKSTLFYILIAIVVILWTATIPVLFYLFSNSSDRGTFGDMFGSINALFSGLALAGIIYTIFLQKKELSLQRKELECTRKELQRSAEAQEKSEVALSNQVNALARTADINGLSAMINHYGKMAEITLTGGGNRLDAKNKADEYVKKLEKILHI